jgi:hypothetical protein
MFITLHAYYALLCIDASNAALKYLACKRSIEVKEIITQAMWSWDCCWYRLTPAQENLHILWLGWLALASNLQKWNRLHSTKQTGMHWQGGLACASQELTFHTFGTGLLSSHNHSICVLNFIYPLNSMEYDDYQKTNKSITKYILMLNIELLRKFKPNESRRNLSNFLLSA